MTYNQCQFNGLSLCDRLLNYNTVDVQPSLPETLLMHSDQEVGHTESSGILSVLSDQSHQHWSQTGQLDQNRFLRKRKYLMN